MSEQNHSGTTGQSAQGAQGADLSGRTVAFLADRGVEEAELAQPWEAVTAAGARAVLYSAEEGTVVSMVGDWDRGREFPVDGPISAADADAIDALVLPGGTLNADAMRIDADAVRLVQQVAAAGTPIAAICHAPWILIEAGVVDGRRMTSYTSVRTDLENAGATWVDEQVVTDGSIITSRNPGDLDAFSAELISRLS